jgi:hypothetical protein
MDESNLFSSLFDAASSEKKVCTHLFSFRNDTRRKRRKERQRSQLKFQRQRGERQVKKRRALQPYSRRKKNPKPRGNPKRRPRPRSTKRRVRVTRKFQKKRMTSLRASREEKNWKTEKKF